MAPQEFRGLLRLPEVGKTARPNQKLLLHFPEVTKQNDSRLCANRRYGP